VSTFPASSLLAQYATAAAHRLRSRLPAAASVAGAAAPLEVIERACQRWLIAYSIAILRVSVGAVFLAFGVLKFFPGLSPAQDLVEATTNILTLGLVPGPVALVGVAMLECVIGLLLISGRAPRAAVYLLGVQLIGILSPLVLLPGRLFAGPHGAPTLEGQYVLKDIVIVGAALVIAATVRGAQLTAPANDETAELATAARPRRASSPSSRPVPMPLPAPAPECVNTIAVPMREAA
jgi:putative oxidoreductase